MLDVISEEQAPPASFDDIKEIQNSICGFSKQALITLSMTMECKFPTDLKM